MGDRTRLSLVWFAYFVAVGVYFPYFSLYLSENAGLSGVEVGLVLALWPLTGIVAQLAWGQLADRTGARGPVLIVACCGSALGFLLLGAAESLTGLVVGSIVAAGFGTAVLPLLFSISFATLREHGPDAFGRVRVWGTISFLLAVVAFPRLLALTEGWRGLEPVAGGPAHPGLGLMFPAIAVFTLTAALAAALLPRQGEVSLRAEKREWRTLLRHPPMRRLIAFSFLAYLFLQGPMALFPVWVVARGGSIETVSHLWVAMLVLEIPLVAYAGAGVRRLGARGLLQLGVLCAGVRWLVCGLTAAPLLVYGVQALHAVVVTGLMLGAPLYLDAIVPERLRSTGQAMLAVAGVGIGGIVSSVAAGWAMQSFGADAPYIAGGVGALLLAAFAPRLLPLPQRPGRERLPQA